MRFQRTVLVLVLALLVLPAVLNLFAQSNPLPPNSAQNSAATDTGGSGGDYQIEKYAQLLSELTSRRRANVYFVNQQSAFHGVQVSCVNVGTGNLTFARRDIVAPGRVPIILARVYDSSAIEKADFGQGWMLSAAERIIVDGQAARLIDETGSELEFVIQGDELLLKRDFPTDYLRLLKSDAAITATLRDGSTKIYSPIEGQYRLTSFTDRNGNRLSVRYKGGLVTESMTQSINTCPANFGNLCSGSDSFATGQGGSAFGVTFPPQHNIFYDQHTTTSTVSFLDQAGISSCVAVCKQTYTCNATVIGTFNVTRTFTKGTIQSTPVTNVAVTKQ
jgi:uncharacterized protein DUF6531